MTLDAARSASFYLFWSIMNEKIIVKANGDHVRQWIQLKQLYAKKRGRDLGRFKKPIPRTTHGDVAQLVKWWHGEYLRALLQSRFQIDNDKAKRQIWLAAKRKIDKQLDGADPKARYPENEWLWQDAIFSLALYLQGRKAVPSRTEILIESVGETVEEHAESAKKLAKRAADAASEVGDRTVSALKAGMIFVGGLAVTAIVVPPLIRAFTRRERE